MVDALKKITEDTGLDFTSGIKDIFKLENGIEVTVYHLLAMHCYMAEHPNEIMRAAILMSMVVRLNGTAYNAEHYLQLDMKDFNLIMSKMV